jgi:hypothetical protein
VPLILRQPPTSAGYTESRAWATSVFRSDGGVETREDLFEAGSPVRSIRAPLSCLDADDVARLRSVLHSGIRASLDVPLWFSRAAITAPVASGDSTIAAPTTGREIYAGSRVALINPATRAGRVYTVDSLTSTAITITTTAGEAFPVGSYAVPVIAATLPAANGMTRFLASNGAAELVLEEITSTGIAAPVETYPDDYGGAPVWGVSWSLPARRNLTEEREGRATVNGEVFNRRTKFNLEDPEVALIFSTMLAIPGGVDEMRRLFDTMRGRLGVFWVPSPVPDYRLATAANSGATSIQIADRGEIDGLAGVTRHLWDEAAQTGHRITSVASAGGGLLNVGITPGLAANRAAGYGLRSLYLSRFAGDTLAMVQSAASPGHAEAEVITRELQGETPDA